MVSLTSGWPRAVTSATLGADAQAGLLGALLVLPQGIAFATLAGLPPQYGLYSAIVPTIVAAAFGSSRHVVSGPTNANSLAILAAISPLATVGEPRFVALALSVTVLVGVIQLAVGAFRLGGLTDFLSPAVLLGFMTGAAALIACYALPDFLGVELRTGDGPFGEVLSLVSGWRFINPAALAVAMTTFAVTLGVRHFAKRLPFMLIGLAAGYAVSALILPHVGGRPVAVVGAIPSPLPSFRQPFESFASVIELLPTAFALALVALGQSVSIAKAIAERSGQRIDVNREFIGQGLANVAGGFFSAYLACGSLNRSVPNLQAGARTPLAAIFSAFFLVALVAVAGPWLGALPMPAVAALLIYTAWSLIDVRRFVTVARISRIEFAIAAATFAAMLVAPFHVAILIGAGVSLVVYLHRTAHPNFYVLAPDRKTDIGRFTAIEDLVSPVECPQLKLLRIEGATYFGAAQYVGDRLHDLRTQFPTQKRLLIMAKSLNFIDVAGAELWDREMTRRRLAGGDLYFHRPRKQVLEVWTRSGFLRRLGSKNVFHSKTDAIGKIFSELDPKICQACQARIFRECGDGSPTSFFDAQGAGSTRDEGVAAGPLKTPSKKTP